MSFLSDVLIGRGAIKTVFMSAAIATSPITVDYASYKIIGRHIASDVISSVGVHFYQGNRQQSGQAARPSPFMYEMMTHNGASHLCDMIPNSPRRTAFCQAVQNHSVFYGPSMPQILEKLDLVNS